MCDIFDPISMLSPIINMIAKKSKTMSLFGKSTDYTKPDKVNFDPLPELEITITHWDGEEWCFNVFQGDWISVLRNEVEKTLSGQKPFITILDTKDNTFIFSSEFLKNCGITVTG